MHKLYDSSWMLSASYPLMMVERLTLTETDEFLHFFYAVAASFDAEHRCCPDRVRLFLLKRNDLSQRTQIDLNKKSDQSI